MKEQLISLPTAILAKEKGFREEVYHAYQPELLEFPFDEDHNDHDDRYSAPTQSLLQRWLREVHKIYVSPMFIGPDTNKFQYRMDTPTDVYHSDWFDTWEECLEAGLLEALKLI